MEAAWLVVKRWRKKGGGGGASKWLWRCKCLSECKSETDMQSSCRICMHGFRSDSTILWSFFLMCNLITFPWFGRCPSQSHAQVQRCPLFESMHALLAFPGAKRSEKACMHFWHFLVLREVREKTLLVAFLVSCIPRSAQHAWLMLEGNLQPQPPAGPPPGPVACVCFSLQLSSPEAMLHTYKWKPKHSEKGQIALLRCVMSHACFWQHTFLPAAILRQFGQDPGHPQLAGGILHMDACTNWMPPSNSKGQSLLHSNGSPSFFMFTPNNISNLAAQPGWRKPSDKKMGKVDSGMLTGVQGCLH